MLTALLVAVGPFLLNVVMELTKYITSVSSTGGKRFALGVLSIAGMIAYSAFNGTPLDINSVSSIASVLVGSFATFLAAHGSYTLLTGNLPSAPQS